MYHRKTKSRVKTRTIRSGRRSARSNRRSVRKVGTSPDFSITNRIIWAVNTPISEAEVSEESQFLRLGNLQLSSIVFPKAKVVSVPVGAKDAKITLKGTLKDVLRTLHRFYAQRRKQIGDHVFFEGFHKNRSGHGYHLAIGS